MSELLTVKDVAAVMKISEDAVTRIFAKVDGVIDLGRTETRSRRRYRILRIPKSTLEDYLSRKAGHPVRVQIPDSPPQVIKLEEPGLFEPCEIRPAERLPRQGSLQTNWQYCTHPRGHKRSRKRLG
jgi:hypothetical protein